MKPALKWLAAAAILALPPSAHALLATCTVATTGIVFPAYASPGSTNSDSTGDIAVTCSALVLGLGSYTISVSTGAGTYANRKLTSGANFLNYNMFTDTARSIVWGDGTAGTQTVSDSYVILVAPTTRHYTSYGRVPGSQNKPAGTYTDTVTVTVTY
ncbi:spore Coat Protein U domain protein [Collimonas fungivorans]|uniref:Spore Coat Protein U domain protein n=1 Tax=Collimonas fungivorans TaxID=158899 RepID=A0A127PD63_9BURK|nr:spore coat protein U domain-containing protein [Collimonas fungivorans]AMO95742.1 spore Coat Protein U domain protein [Collimonas fungivorans]